MDQKTARAFNRVVTNSGYRAFHLAFGEGNLDHVRWAEHVEGLADPLRGLVRLFLLQQKLVPARVQALLGTEITAALIAAQILDGDGDSLRSRMVLNNFRSLLFFHEHGPHPGVYFGDDSVALGIYQTPTFGGITLDLCSGSAIQAMISAHKGSRAYSVEINPYAAAIARINVMINALDHKVVVVNRSLEAFANEVQEKLDLVTFNPPLLPVPESLDFPLVGHGGVDALEVTRRALRAYLPHVNDGGAIEFIGTGLGVGGHPSSFDELAKLAAEYDTSLHAQLLHRAPLRRGTRLYDILVSTAAVNNGIPVGLCHEVFSLHFEKLGMTDLWLFFVRGTRGQVQPARVTDLGRPSFWFI